MARQEEAIRSQRRLLGLLAAALSAMIFLFGFLAWYLFGREPEPTFASADMEQSEGAEIPDLLMDEAAGEGVELASLDPDPAEDSSGSNGAAAGGSRPNSAAASAGGTASGSRREPAAKVEAPTDSGPVAAADKPDLSVEKTSPATRKTDAPSADAGTAGLRRKPSVEADRSQQETAAEPLALRIAHKPVSQAALGSTKRLEVKVEGPDDTRVVLHYGVEGDWKKKTMKRGAGSVYSCSFSFDSPGKLYYWVVAQHPETRPRRALSGQRFEPHVVSVY